jgi:hypothetical protein
MIKSRVRPTGGGNVFTRTLKRLPPTAYFSLIGVILLALIPLSILFTSKAQDQVNTANEKSASVASAAAEPIRTVEELCARGDAQAAELLAQGKCLSAAKAKQEVDSAPTPAPVPGLTQSQVLGLIEGQIKGLPRPLSVDQVAGIAADIYAKNKPADGKNATPEMILDVVKAFCADRACKGKDAPPATPEEIRAQVVAYCESRTDKCVGPAGPTGKQGAQGTSVRRQYFERDGGGVCQSRAELFDPATGNTTIMSAPAGDAACPVNAPSSPPTP